MWSLGGSEPAVIHHEPFDTGIPGLIGQSFNVS